MAFFRDSFRCAGRSFFVGAAGVVGVNLSFPLNSFVIASKAKQSFLVVRFVGFITPYGRKDCFALLAMTNGFKPLWRKPYPPRRKPYPPKSQQPKINALTRI